MLSLLRWLTNQWWESSLWSPANHSRSDRRKAQTAAAAKRTFLYLFFPIFRLVEVMCVTWERKFKLFSTLLNCRGFYYLVICVNVKSTFIHISITRLLCGFESFVRVTTWHLFGERYIIDIILLLLCFLLRSWYIFY